MRVSDVTSEKLNAKNPDSHCQFGVPEHGKSISFNGNFKIINDQSIHNSMKLRTPTLYTELTYVSNAEDFVQQALKSSSVPSRMESPLETQLQFRLQLSNQSSTIDQPDANSNEIFQYTTGSNNFSSLQSGELAQGDYYSRQSSLNDGRNNFKNLESSLSNQNCIPYNDNSNLQNLQDVDYNSFDANAVDHDESLTSGSTSRASSSNSHRTYFPRGIINPNYPGFQHLAHTLSEHFIENGSIDYYESDISDFEPDDLPKYHQLAHMENNNFDSDVHSLNGDHLSDGIRVVCSDNQSSAQENFINNQRLNLLTQIPRDVCTANTNIKTVTPDILRKQLKTMRDENAVRPDLLHGVSPHRTCGNPKGKLLNKPDYDQSHLHCTTGDEQYLTMTPIDIIGDFKQEVEREFGLLVNGYTHLSNRRVQNFDNIHGEQIEKVDDAVLSNAKDDINTNQLLKTPPMKEHISLETETAKLTKMEEETTQTQSDFNASESNQKLVNLNVEGNLSATGNNQLLIRSKPKYKKSSCDDRLLPPVVIEYKSLRPPKKQIPKEKCRGNNKRRPYSKSTKVCETHPKSHSNRKHEEDEFQKYQQLISDKDSILHKSRYAKMSTWAEYLKNCSNDSNNKDIISANTLELFDAYKIGAEIDIETLEKHLEMAQEIEKKRRDDREEIRRRLAMDINVENGRVQDQYFEATMQKVCEENCSSDPCSDTESDSETCPKLSKKKYLNQITDDSKIMAPKCTLNKTKKLINGEDHSDGINFFTKQAKLQIEARTALSQAKEVAHRQMEIERRKRRAILIAKAIHGSLERIGINIPTEQRHITRQLLTDINIAQLQILVNSMHTHIHDHNEMLMHFLMERDELRLEQDNMLHKIEQFTRYLCEIEHAALHN